MASIQFGHIVINESNAGDIGYWAHEEHHKLWGMREKEEDGSVRKLGELYSELIEHSKTIHFGGPAATVFLQTLSQFLSIDAAEIDTLYDFFVGFSAEKYKDMDAEEFWVQYADNKTREDFIRSVQEGKNQENVVHLTYFIQ